MADQPTLKRPVRAGVFSHEQNAESAVRNLIAAGFTAEEITVVCSDKAIEKRFERFHHQDPAGDHTTEAAATGGVLGATLGGVLGGLTAVGVVASGGTALLAAGGLLAFGGVAGSLIGAFMTRGMEKELADFYDQAVVQGKILVAAERQTEGATPTLADAERILSEAGAHPVALPSG